MRQDSLEALPTRVREAVSELGLEQCGGWGVVATRRDLLSEFPELGKESAKEARREGALLAVLPLRDSLGRFPAMAAAPADSKETSPRFSFPSPFLL